MVTSLFENPCRSNSPLISSPRVRSLSRSGEVFLAHQYQTLRLLRNDFVDNWIL